MICHSVLREIISTDLLRTFPTSNLRSSLGSSFLQFFLLLYVKQPGPEHRHGFHSVPDLRSFILAGSYYAGRQVGKPDGCGYLVNILATCSATSKKVHFYIISIDIYFDILCFRQNSDSRCGSMDSPGRFGFGPTLHTVDTLFI